MSRFAAINRFRVFKWLGALAFHWARTVQRINFRNLFSTELKRVKRCVASEIVFACFFNLDDMALISLL